MSDLTCDYHVTYRRELVIKDGKFSIIFNFNVSAKCYSLPGYYQMGADEHQFVKFGKH